MDSGSIYKTPSASYSGIMPIEPPVSPGEQAVRIFRGLVKGVILLTQAFLVIAVLIFLLMGIANLSEDIGKRQYSSLDEVRCETCV